MTDVSDRKLQPKERAAKDAAIADRIERINEALADIGDERRVSGRAAEEHIHRAREALTAAADDLKPD